MGTTRSDNAAKALFGRTRRNILALLFGRPGESFYLREIVRLAGTGTGAVQRELTRLTAAGLLRRSANGNQVYFEANPDSPIYQELRSLIVKTAGIADVLRAALLQLADKERISLAFIYGSVASATQDPGSDVDLIIVGDLQLSALLPRLRQVQEQIGREVNPTIISVPEFTHKLKMREHFLHRVMAGDRIFLVGNADELEQLAR